MSNRQNSPYVYFHSRIKHLELHCHLYANTLYYYHAANIY